MPDNWFDETTATTYDEDEAAHFAASAVDPVVETLAELAGDGAALEFAIGTGRIALPLSARGVPVSGVELSPAMVGRLRGKPGGSEAEIPVVIGDMATAQVDGSFTVVYLVYNTIMNLTTQEQQVQCFANAARHLAPGGHFAAEVLVPALRRLSVGERFVPFEVTSDHIGIDEYDTAAQSLVSHHVISRDGRQERSSTPFRYVWPAELDLMASIAGLQLTDRWSDWTRSPFTDASPGHISIWRKPLQPPGL